MRDCEFAADAYVKRKMSCRESNARNKSVNWSRPSGATFSNDRGPILLRSALQNLTKDFGWSTKVAEANVLTDWPQLVGEKNAEHTRPTGFENGVLHVQCDSTAWATELRRMNTQILTKIASCYPEANITALRFLAPGAPSWRHGIRVATGRGPRDTYG